MHLKKTLRSMLRLATGEVGSRLASFLLFAYISRQLGVEVLGFVVLAQTVAIYVTCGTDLGLRFIGARLVAKDPSSAEVVIGQLTRKRILLCSASVIVGCAYGYWGPMPSEARLYVIWFSLAVVPYALSLDWLAWGMNHLGWLGGWRAGVSFIFVSAAIAAIRFTKNPLLSITAANFASVLVGVIVLWTVWRISWRPKMLSTKYQKAETDDIAEQLAWNPVVTLGLAVILNMMFKNFDTIMLGGMSTAPELGRYAAASKILFLVFNSYYLIMQTIYPQLSRVAATRMRSVVTRAVVSVAALGVLVGFVTAIFAPFILRIVYGSDLNATPLLRILAISVPFDFCAALLGTLFVSRGQDRVVLITGLVSAASNIALNLLLIPRMQATGAAWATFGSYIVVVVLLLGFVGRIVKSDGKLMLEQEPEPLLAR